MNLLSSFSDFYYGLSSDGLFFFWIIVFLFCFLIFLTIVLVIKNKKLTKLLNEDNNITLNNVAIKNEMPVMEQNEIIEENNEQIIEIKGETSTPVIEEKPVIEKQEETKVEDKIEETGPYKKNVLREMNARMQTSPISINRDNNINTVTYDVEDSDDYGFDESYLREDSVSPLESMEDSYEVSDNMKFASEIVERMEEEVKPSNIELTDYEKKQEEEAIISYDELLKVKDKIYNITEDEETDEFIDQLKSFRLDL